MDQENQNHSGEERNVGLVKKDETIIVSEPQNIPQSNSTQNGEATPSNINTTTENTSTNKLDEILVNIQKLNTIVTSLNTIRNSTVELDTIYEELVYFNRMVRPLVDSLYFISLSTQGLSLASQALNNINLAKPKQVETSICVAYELIKETSCIFETFKMRMDCYLNMVENDKC